MLESRPQLTGSNYCHSDQPTAHDAFSCLINLSDSILVSRRIATPDYLGFLVSYIFHPSSLLADLASMLLSNLTKLDSAAKALVELKVPGKALGMPDEELTGLELLLAAFDQGATVTTAASSAALEEMKKRASAGNATTTAQEKDEPVKQEEERKSNCHFLASVFANVTAVSGRCQEDILIVSARSEQSNRLSAPLALLQLSSGRDFFTTPLNHDDLSTMPAGRLFPYTEHPDLIRRGGAISSLKNILFIKSVHAALIAPPSSVDDVDASSAVASTDASSSTLPPLRRPVSSTLDVLPSLLLPLCNDSLFSSLDEEEQLSLPDELQFLDDGSAEGKKVERDVALRSMLVESLLLLGTTLYGRRCMRERGVYLVVRELHKNETDERIGESILRLVNLLKREESSATMADAEGGDAADGDAGVEGGSGEKSADQKAIDEIIGAEEVGKKEESDGDEDLVIEEL